MNQNTKKRNTYFLFLFFILISYLVNVLYTHLLAKFGIATIAIVPESMNQLHGDSKEYYNIALSILNGTGFSYDGVNPTTIRPP